jgi:hypothetical protein
MIRLALCAIAFALLTAGCSGDKNAAPQEPGSPSAPGSTPSGVHSPRYLIDLHDIGQLRSLFNMRSGQPRLILLASPT